MARGDNQKTEIINKILEVFPNAFIDGKNIRISCKDDENQPLEVEVKLTAKKDILGGQGSTPEKIPKVPVHNDFIATSADIKKARDILTKLGY